MRNLTRNAIVYVLLTVVVPVVFFSCEKEIPAVNAPQNYPADNYSEIFESFWNGMNNNYVFWSVDHTDWDGVYKQYKPLFAKLKSFSKQNDSIAEIYFTDMTVNLIDSHYSITFSSTGHTVSPALNRKVLIDKSYPDSIYSLPSTLFTNTIPFSFLDPATVQNGTDTLTQGTEKIPFTVVSGTIDGKILYLYFNGFYFSQAGANVTPAIDRFFANLLNLSASLTGIIIDVRENGGGEVSDLNYLIGKMIGAPVTFGYTRAKNGIGRLDYTPWAPAIVTPQPGAIPIKAPIVVLADHLSASMAEMTVLAIKSLPNGKFIGTTTWGANGPLAPSVYYNGGQFTVGANTFGPNGYMFVYTSSTMFEGINGTVYEGRGISPDHWVQEYPGGDNQLSAAITYINTH